MGCESATSCHLPNGQFKEILAHGSVLVPTSETNKSDAQIASEILGQQEAGEQTQGALVKFARKHGIEP